MFTGKWVSSGNLEEYFKKNIKSTDIKSLENSFLDIMSKMLNVFLGLIILNNNKIVHLDIKPSNIMYDKKNFKIIDFGLSSKIDDIEHFRHRAYKESKTNRIYLWYPPSYLISQLSFDELDELEVYIKNYNFSNYYKSEADVYDRIRKHYDQSTHKTYNTNYYKLIRKGIIKFKTQEDIDNRFNSELDTIDTYSLGMIFPYLFIKNNLLKYVKNSTILKPFFELFRLMINPEVSRRIEICEATLLLNSLIVLNNGPNKLSEIKRVLKQKENDLKYNTNFTRVKDYPYMSDKNKKYMFTKKNKKSKLSVSKSKSKIKSKIKSKSKTKSNTNSKTKLSDER